LKQIDCSYSRIHNIQNGFQHSSVIIFEVNIVTEQKQTYWWKILCFL